CNQTLAPCVVPMRLASDAAHYPIGIKCQVAYRIDPFFFRLEIFGHRRPVWSGQRRVRTRSRFGSAPQATTARPTGNRLPLFVWILRRTVLPSKPLRLSPIDKVTPCFAK